MDTFQSQGLCLDDDDYFDMTVTIHGKRFRCIRSILSNRSTFFVNVSTSMQHLYHSPKHVYVDLEGFPGGADTFQIILDFCHAKKIHVIADQTFLYLHQAAAFLEMNRSVANLEDRCELFWKDHILSSWESILGIMAMLKKGNLVLSKYQIGLCFEKCLRGLDLVMKDMNYRDLDRWICKLVILSTEHLKLVLNTKINWSQCTSKHVLKSFSLAVHYLGIDGTSLVDKLGLIAKYLLEEKILEDENTKGLLVLKDFMALKDVQHIIYILVLLQGLSELMHKLKKRYNYEYLKWRYLDILKLEDLGVSSPESVLQMIIKFYTPEDGVLKENGKRFILSYLDRCKKNWCSLSFESFFASAKTLSGILKDCHDALYDQIISYEKSKDLSEEEKNSLGSLVNVATLSSDRVEQVLQSEFPFSLKAYVCLLRKENAYLKKQQKRRLLNEDKDSNLQFPKKRSKKVGETSTNVVRQSVQNHEEIGYAGKMGLYKEIEYEKKMEGLANFCSSFHVSVITLAAEDCFSFQIKASDVVSTIRKKLIHQMEKNCVKTPAKGWKLGKGWTVMKDTSTAQENGIGPHSLLRVLLLQKEGCPSFESEESIQMPSVYKTEQKMLELKCSESETGNDRANTDENSDDELEDLNLNHGTEDKKGTLLLEAKEVIARMTRELSDSSEMEHDSSEIEADSGNMSELGEEDERDGSGYEEWDEICLFSPI